MRLLKMEAALDQQLPWFDKTGNPEMIGNSGVAPPMTKSVFVFAKRRADR